MRRRSIVVVVCVSLPLVFAAFACDSTDSAPGGTFTPPDAGFSNVDSAQARPAPSAPDAARSLDTGLPDSGIADAGADAADAAPVTLLPSATGLGRNGMTLDDGQIDPHWTVKSADGVALTSYVQTDALGFIGSWMRPTTTSKFISPFADTVDPTGMGTFTYTTTFVLGAGVTVADVQLVIRYASDNVMTGISVNGQALATVNAGGYSVFETVTVRTPFVVGTNTVSMTVANGGGPTGLRAELELVR